MGHTSEFLLAFTSELQKQIFIETLLKWANKKQNNFNVYNVAFKKKIKKTPGDMIHYYTPVCQKS